jgi:putative NIF3 family GTP cyclohydrolase 1 type 2
MKILEVLNRIKEFHPPIDEEHTCDTVKTGDLNRECNGIGICIYVSPNVIREAIEKNINLLICHEPVFYTDQDPTKWLENNQVYLEKRKLLDDHGIVVWRDHDHIHGGSPSRQREYMDMIYQGIMKELDWEQYCIGFPNKPLLYEIPETTVAELTEELIKKFNLNGARIVGNQNAKVKKVFFCEHISGGGLGEFFSDCNVIREIEKEGYDVMIPLEIVDWTLSEYVRDAAQLGKNKAIIEMGHFNVEELGMKYMEKWLAQIVGEQITVQYMQSGDCFSYITRNQAI